MATGGNWYRLGHLNCKNVKVMGRPGEDLGMQCTATGLALGLGLHPELRSEVTVTLGGNTYIKLYLYNVRCKI